jgi:Protein of unknown function (DUF3710)
MTGNPAGAVRERTAREEGGTVIFSRDGGSGGRHAAGDDRGDGPQTGSEPTGSGRHASDRRPATPVFAGPYDIEDAPAYERVDLGSLQIPTVEGVEVRVQANAEGVIQQVVLGYQDSVLQLGVFAAPRSEGIWDEVRPEIRKQLFTDGVAVEEATGDYGPELRARVRQAEGMLHIRFIGVDGPRWMVRAVYQGRAAEDTSAAGPLAACLAGLVVNRGKDAMPVREALPLRLPKEIADQARAQAAAQQAAAETAAPVIPPAAAPSAPPSANGHAAAADPEAGRRRPSPRPRRAE